jgi:hydroxymethylpyrimidine pyrophosphatase-like HAD family hydrolase
MIIAVDFDGTIVEHKYPAIGAVRPFAFESLRALQANGFRIILWTHRSGPELEHAVAFCLKNKVEFYAVNKNYPEEEWLENGSRKILADLYIDDRNFGGIPSWGEIYHELCPESNLPQLNKKPWFKR